MKKIFLAVIGLVVIGSAVELNSQSPGSIAKRLINNGQLDAKHLKLRLKYLWVIPVAEAKMDNLGKERFRGRELTHVHAEAMTFDYVRSIFHAKAAVDSYVAPEALLPVYFLEHLEMINQPARQREIYYDQKQRIMVTTENSQKEERRIEPDTYEPLSALFFLQNQGLKQGGFFELNLNTNQKTYRLTCRIYGDGEINLNGERCPILVAKARVSRKDKNPRHAFVFKIWFLKKDGQFLPILVRAMTNIGPIVAVAE